MKTISIINIAKTGFKQFFDIDPNITEHLLTQGALHADLVKADLLHTAHLKKQILIRAFGNWATTLRPAMDTPEYAA